jgi:hypothetical protein
MTDQPWIDFDGDGHGDTYHAVAYPEGLHEYEHFDHHGHIDAIAWDFDHDGRMESLAVDDNHDGHLDRLLHDDNGDGIMDSSQPFDQVGDVRHPYIDFNGDGRGDHYYTTTDGRAQAYVHTDGHGHIDAKAVDRNDDGLIDEMYVDDNHDGRFDRLLVDTNGDGIMDRSGRA